MKLLTDTLLHEGKKNVSCHAHGPHLSERLTEFSQDALLVKHLALVSVLIIVMDFLSEVSRQLVEGHVLLHLLVLRERQRWTDMMFC